MTKIDNIYDHPNCYSLADFPSERWMLVTGTEYQYFVSNLGRVKISAGPSIKTGRGTRPRFLRICYIGNVKGYRNVRIDGKMRLCHQLVALAFIGEKPTPEHQVNHKNGLKWDNRVENLEWVTVSQNVKHAFDTGLHKGLRGIDRPESKPVAQYRKDGCLMSVYGSMHAAEIGSGALRVEISKACTGKRGTLTAGGFIWKCITKEEYFMLKEKLEHEAQPIQAGSV